MSISSTSTTNALTGLSGYDFSGIITSMVQSYKLPETQMVTQQTTLQTQQSAWRDVNTRLSNLDGTISALQSAATWTATTATSSNTNSVTSTGGCGALPGSYATSVVNIASAEVVVSQQTNDTTFPASMPAYSYNSGTSSSNWDFSINGKNVVIGKSSSTGTAPTLVDICNSINSAQTGVTASLIQVDSTNYRLSITSNQTGLANGITFADPNGILGQLGLTLDGSGHPSPFTGVTTSGGISQQAADASFTVNGVSITSATNAVTTAIQGVTLNLNAAGASTVTVATDPSVAQKAVQAFVDQYNSVQSFISSKLSYDTTTKMAGDLFGDQQLQDIQSKLRGMLGGVFGNPSAPYTVLSDVGISTSSDNFGEDASLTFDTSKFTQAFAANPQSVANLFSAPYNGVTPLNDTVNNVYQGLGNTLHAYLYPVIMYGGSLSQTNDSYNSQIKDVQDQISNFEVQATAYQTMLNAKFANLETVLSGLNAQGSWLTGQINAMSGSNSTSSTSKA